MTVKGADEPAAMVAGSEIPERVNSLLVMLDDETVTEAPVAFRAPLSDEVEPTVTVPKLNVGGETAS